MTSRRYSNKKRLPLVLVYGTLKKGYRFHNVMQDSGATFLGDFRTEPVFTLIDLGEFPAVLRKGKQSVRCELYQCSTGLLHELDHIEQVPNLYVRMRTPTNRGPAFIYVLSPKFITANMDALPTWPIVSNGDWDPKLMHIRTEDIPWIC